MSRPGRCTHPRIREILETLSVPRIFKNIRGIPYRIKILFHFHSEDPSNSQGRLFLIVYFSQSVALLPSLSLLFPFFFPFSIFYLLCLKILSFGCFCLCQDGARRLKQRKKKKKRKREREVHSGGNSCI